MHYFKDKRFVSIALLFILMIVVMPYDGMVINSIRQFKAQEGLLNTVFAFLMPIAKFVGDGTFIALVAVIIWLIGRLIKRDSIRQVGSLMFISYLVSGITAQVLKHTLGRARPRLTDDIVFIGPSFASGFDSFPSGHTTVVFCLAYIFSLRHKRFAVAFYTVAIITALERIYNMSHFPSDVIGGIITGLLTAIFINTKMVHDKGLQPPDPL